MIQFYIRNKLLLILPIVAFVFFSCVDTSEPVIPSSINYNSQIKVVNLVSGSGNTTFTLDNKALGNANFGEETPTGEFLTVPSGSKSLKATFANSSTKTFQFAAPTEYKFRVFLFGDLTKSDAKVLTQRYIWQTKNSQEGSPLFPDGKGQLLLFNGSPDAVINSLIVGNDTVHFSNPLALGSSTPYYAFNSGTYTIKIIYNNTSVLTFDRNLGSQNRYTIAVYDSASSLKSNVFLDD